MCSCLADNLRTLDISLLSWKAVEDDSFTRDSDALPGLQQIALSNFYSWNVCSRTLPTNEAVVFRLSNRMFCPCLICVPVYQLCDADGMPAFRQTLLLEAL